VDFSAAVADELSDEDVADLEALHARLFRLPSHWAQHLEGSWSPHSCAYLVHPRCHRRSTLLHRYASARRSSTPSRSRASRRRLGPALAAVAASAEHGRWTEQVPHWDGLDRLSRYWGNPLCAAYTVAWHGRLGYWLFTRLGFYPGD
jgi:hypothetical protein